MLHRGSPLPLLLSPPLFLIIIRSSSSSSVRLSASPAVDDFIFSPFHFFSFLQYIPFIPSFSYLIPSFSYLVPFGTVLYEDTSIAVLQMKLEPQLSNRNTHISRQHLSSHLTKWDISVPPPCHLDMVMGLVGKWFGEVTLQIMRSCFHDSEHASVRFDLFPLAYLFVSIFPTPQRACDMDKRRRVC
jgi:hypothetical protein